MLIGRRLAPGESRQRYRRQFAVSISAATYERLHAHSREVDVPMQAIVGQFAEGLATLTAEQVAQLVDWCRGQDPAAAARRSRIRRKVSDDAVVAIRAARASGRKLRTIAAEHGISIPHASRIASGMSHPRSSP